MTVFCFEYSYAEGTDPLPCVRYITVEVLADTEATAKALLNRHVKILLASQFHRVGTYTKQIVFHDNGDVNEAGPRHSKH